MSATAEKRILQYVSRETYEKFVMYMELVTRWNRQTSLVQVQTLDHFMERHILDSLQLLPVIEDSAMTIDIGTGAGFPGMVLAISGIKNITLCDSNNRKTVFLSEVKRELDVNVEVICSRIENLQCGSYTQVVSRAYAELNFLLGQTLFVSRETKNSPTLVALKGQAVEQEIAKAREEFNFNYEKINSVASPNGVILKISDIVKL